MDSGLITTAVGAVIGAVSFAFTYLLRKIQKLEEAVDVRDQIIRDLILNQTTTLLALQGDTTKAERERKISQALTQLTEINKRLEGE